MSKIYCLRYKNYIKKMKFQTSDVLLMGKLSFQPIVLYVILKTI